MKVVFWQSLLRVLVEFYIMRDHVCWNNLFWEQVRVCSWKFKQFNIFLWRMATGCFGISFGAIEEQYFALLFVQGEAVRFEFMCLWFLVLKFALFDSVTFSLICKELQAGGWICDPLSPAKWFGLLRLHSR
jgi:hypothetical protein